MYASIGQAAEIIGVSISTLRRWENEGSLFADFRTNGGHRRYSINKIRREVLDIKDNTKVESTNRKTYISIKRAARCVRYLSQVRYI